MRTDARAATLARCLTLPFGEVCPFETSVTAYLRALERQGLSIVRVDQLHDYELVVTILEISPSPSEEEPTGGAEVEPDVVFGCTCECGTPLQGSMGQVCLGVRAPPSMLVEACRLMNNDSCSGGRLSGCSPADCS